MLNSNEACFPELFFECHFTSFQVLPMVCCKQDDISIVDFFQNQRLRTTQLRLGYLMLSLEVPVKGASCHIFETNKPRFAAVINKWIVSSSAGTQIPFEGHTFMNSSLDEKEAHTRQRQIFAKLILLFEVPLNRFLLFLTSALCYLDLRWIPDPRQFLWGSVNNIRKKCSSYLNLFPLNRIARAKKVIDLRRHD